MSRSASQIDGLVRTILADQPDREPCIEVLDDAMVAVLRGKSSAERLETAYGMWRFARDTVRRVVARQHPDWSDDQVKRESARRLVHGTG